MIGVIADDLTGAAEIGAVGWRHGLRAEVVVEGEPGRDADLICLDTDSRLCPPEEAAQRARKAALVLRNRGAEWIYKKTDSLLRGNVTPEIEAILKELDLSGALLVPANPSLGRTIVDGQYLVHGSPVHETEFSRDPSHPRSSPRILDLLAQPSLMPLFVRKPSEPLPARGIVVGEVANSGNLLHWAFRRDSKWLMAGGSEFFGSLLKPGKPCPQAGLPPGRELFVCGSASEATRKFVAMQAKKGVPVLSLPETVAFEGALSSKQMSALATAAAAAFEAEPRVILHAGLAPLADAALAGMLAMHLVRVAERVLQAEEVAHVLAEGGATAVALARRMGWQRLAVTEELAPGVATLSVLGGGSLFLTIKPGSYAWPKIVRNKSL
jgi:D-threonate/D-erythronate kinase